MWLSHRCFAAKAQDAIPIFGPLGLASQLGNVEYSRPRKFREKLQTWLDVIKAMWPDCPAEISMSGEHLMIRPASALTWEDR